LIKLLMFRPIRRTDVIEVYAVLFVYVYYVY